ncbi:MAG TPA: hypothetical protein PK264_00275 [Hyphomicrobiaceae bacterium]|nr:hypothetical protein [Hyphomicrobiaceae bacterium]
MIGTQRRVRSLAFVVLATVLAAGCRQECPAITGLEGSSLVLKTGNYTSGDKMEVVLEIKNAPFDLDEAYLLENLDVSNRDMKSYFGWEVYNRVLSADRMTFPDYSLTRVEGKLTITLIGEVETREGLPYVSFGKFGGAWWNPADGKLRLSVILYANACVDDEAMLVFPSLTIE